MTKWPEHLGNLKKKSPYPLAIDKIQSNFLSEENASLFN